jgi:hypothetical protein
MTESSKTTTQSQSSTSRPWDESMGLVNTLLGQYGSLNPGVTAGQKSSLENLRSSLSGLPNYGDAASGAVSNIFGSASSAPQVGMLNTAYDSLRTNLAPTAGGANLDPYSTPGFRDAIQTAINDTTNQVKGSYAASGRDPSGAGSFAQSLGRGLGWFVYAVSGSYRRKLRANLARAGLPATLRGPAAGAAGAMIGELPWVWFRDPAAVLARIRCDDDQAVREARAAGRGVIYLTPHLGCFEVVARWCAGRAPITVLFRPSKLAAMAPVLQAARNHGEMTALPANLTGVRGLLRALKRGEAVGLLPVAWARRRAPRWCWRRANACRAAPAGGCASSPCASHPPPKPSTPPWSG